MSQILHQLFKFYVWETARNCSFMVCTRSVQKITEHFEFYGSTPIIVICTCLKIKQSILGTICKNHGCGRTTHDSLTITMRLLSRPCQFPSFVPKINLLILQIWLPTIFSFSLNWNHCWKVIVLTPLLM